MNLKLIDLQVCDKCGRGFVTSSVLKEHAKLHSGTKKSFGCTTCGAKYASFADLKIHQRRYIHKQKCYLSGFFLVIFSFILFRHTGELPFCCFKCDKGFRSKRLLQEHGRSMYFHSKCCAIWRKFFLLAIIILIKNNLSLGHFEAKPFACANCGKTFTSASGLRQHFKRHDTCKLASLPGAFGLGTVCIFPWNYLTII